MMACEKGRISLKLDCICKMAFLLWALFLLSGICHSGNNILLNGGFEQKRVSPKDSEYEVDGWWRRSCTQWATDKVHSGSYAAKVEVTDASLAGEKNYWISNMLSASGKLKVSCWVKTEAVARGEKDWHTAGVVVRMYDENKQGVAAHYGHFSICKVEGTTEWTNYQQEIDLLPEAKYIAVECGLYCCMGKLWIDDIEITSEAADAAKPNP